MGETGSSEACVYRDIPEDLRLLIEPIVAEQDCELVDVDIRPHSSDGMIRITIDNTAGDGRVPIACCAEVSREIAVQLDTVDFMPGKYRLEVTSPGLDRILAREKDFESACGSEVKLKTRRPIGERRRFKGMMVDFRDGVAVLEIDGNEVKIPFEEVEKANSLYQFSRDDFAGQESGDVTE